MCDGTPRLERWRHQVAEATKLVDELVHLVAAVTRLAIECRQLLDVVVPPIAALLALH